MALEQLIAKLGLNIGPFVRALEFAKRHAKGFGADLAKETGSELQKTLGGALSVGALFTATRSVADYAAAIKDLSADLGVSTDFLQGFTSGVAKNGGTADAANAALQRFSVLVGEAASGSLDAQSKLAQFGATVTDQNGNLRNTESIMLDVVDSISRIESPAERASAAVELFGKSGQQLLGFISQGRKGIEEFIAATDKLSTQSIRDLAEAKSTIEGVFRSITIGIGNAVSAVGKFFRVLGALSVTGSVREAIKSVSDEDFKESQNAQSSQAVKARASIFDELKNKIAKEREDQRKKEIEAEKKLGDEMKRNLEKLHQFNEQRKAAQAGLLGAQAALSQRRGDRGRFTLEELATSNLRFSGRLGQEQIQAREAFMLERFAEINRLRGFGDLSLQQLSRAEQIRGGLTNLQQAERFPFADLTDRVEQSNAELRRLNALAQTEGVLIRPTNGE